MTTNMPLYHLTLAQILEDMAKGCVANIVTPEGSSHWNLFSYLLFHHVLLTIVVIKPLDVNCGNDLSIGLTRTQVYSRLNQYINSLAVENLLRKTPVGGIYRVRKGPNRLNSLFGWLFRAK